MNREVIVSCAVTGAGDTVGKHPDIPVTPEQIATAAIEAAKAGAAIAHCHVREPDGAPSRNLAFYGEVVERTADFAPAFERASAAQGPALIELRVDPEAITPATTLGAIREAAEKRRG